MIQRLSEDSARIFMEMLISLISSPQASSDVKLEAVRAFSKMRCSSTMASRAYKAGNKLIMSLQQDECKAEMLSSLSKLAYNSSLLILEQMDLLLSFLSCESSSLLRARALKCICFLANRGACRFTFTETVLVALLNIIDDNDLPPNFHCEALRILCKIFHLSDFFGIRTPTFFKLILIVETTAKSSVKKKRCLALRLLVDSLCSMKRELQTHWCSNPEKWHDILFQFHVSLPAVSVSSCSCQDGPTLLVCHVILLIINRINFLMDQTIVLRCRKPILIPHDGLLEAKLEFKSLCNLILHLAREYPSSIQVALVKIRCLISMVGSHNWKSPSTGGEASEIELGGEIQNPILSTKSDYELETSAFSELMLYLYRFMDACLSILDESGSFNSEVYHLVKLFIDCIQQSRYCTFDLYEIFCLHIHAYVLSRSCEVTNCIQDFRESVVAVELGFSHNVSWGTQEVQALDFAKKMLERRNHWTAYRVGKNSCCQGAWFTAAYTFRKLIGMVESKIFRCWIKSLMLLAGAESETKLLLFPKVGTEMINAMQTEAYSEKEFSSVEQEMDWYDGRDSDLCGSEGKLARVYSRIRASEESLAAAGASGGVYYFQRWFLSLRAKVLVSVVEMLGLLDSHTFTGEKSNKCFEGNIRVDLTQVSQTMHALASEFTQISFQFNNLAEEYDFLAVSFMDIDLRSFRSISSLALSCSVLAFCTAFALYFLTTPAGSVESSRVDKGEIIIMSVIKDLFERLCNIDSILAAKLQRLMTEFEKETNNLYTRTEVNSTSHTDRSVLLVYKYAILGVLNIQEDAKAVKDEESLCALVLRGLRLLSDIIRKWMEIPFRTPNYFFRVSPCVGAELFIFNTDARCTEGLSVPLGCLLSLNLSIQLVNVSKKSRSQVTDIYCILAVNSSDCLTSGAGERVRQEQPGFQPCKTNEMVKLNEMLLRHIRTDTGNDIQKQCEINVDSMVTTFVHFELNGKGQGFSTCMIDVSALHEGSYQIKWHSCSVDKKHNYWSLLPMNPFPLFTIRKS